MGKTNNDHGTFIMLGATNHSTQERQNDDYYATEPRATKLLLENEEFSPNIWECACGGGAYIQYP